MPSLQVRELPEHIYRKLNEGAVKEHRSLAQQAVVILAQGLGIEDDNKARRKKLLEKMAAKEVDLSKYQLPSPVASVREDRSR